MAKISLIIKICFFAFLSFNVYARHESTLPCGIEKIALADKNSVSIFFDKNVSIYWNFYYQPLDIEGIAISEGIVILSRNKKMVEMAQLYLNGKDGKIKSMPSFELLPNTEVIFHEHHSSCKIKSIVSTDAIEVEIYYAMGGWGYSHGIKKNTSVRILRE